jgi:integrase
MAQGSITKHIAKDGTVSYRARADGGIDPATGKRRQIMKTFRTRKEAESWIREQQRRADRGEWVDAHKATLGEWITEWLASAGARGRRESTQRIYITLLRGRVVPALGAVTLARLSPAILERFFRQEEQQLKPSSVRTLYAALRVCLADAERLDLIASNPLRKVRAPKVPPVERPSWTPEEARRFWAVAATGEDLAFWLVLLTCGLRIGEALALTWEDCDLERATLRVRRTITTDRRGSPVMGGTTKSGKPRTLPLAPSVVEVLRQQRAHALAQRLACADIWEDHNLVFPGITGGPRSATMIRYRLDGLCKEAKVTRLTPHGLRHTAASMLAEHAPVAVARDVLGHSSLAITNTYIHASDQAARAGAATLAYLLTGS